MRRKHLETFLMRRYSFYLLTTILLVSLVGSFSSANASLESLFPGPVPVDVVGAGLCILEVSAVVEGQQDLLVATDEGFLSIINYVNSTTSLRTVGRTFIGGQPVKMIPWEGYSGVGQGFILSTREPDKVHFMEMNHAAPYFEVLQQISLPEDPGGMAFAGGAGGSDLDLAITLPGVDQIIILESQEGLWSIKQILAGGDTPADLAAIDIDGNQILEFVSADSGALSQSLSIFGQESEGNWSLLGHEVLEGCPSRVRPWDLDNNGTMELVVGYSDISHIAFFDVQDSQFSLLGSVFPSVIPSEFRLEYNEIGQSRLFVANAEQGVIDFFQGQEFPFTRLNTFYPGCQPAQISLCDFNGDNKSDMIALGLVNPVVTVMFWQQGDGFEGYPALPLPTQPGTGILDDFNGDGFTDLVVAGQVESLLDFFPGTAHGLFDPYPENNTFSSLLKSLTAVQADDDQAMELAVIDPSLGQVRVMDYVPGTGFVEIYQMPLGVGAVGLQAADCDNDGLADLVGISPSERAVKIYYGLADGMFTEPESVVFNNPVKDVKALDLTGDSLLDLVVSDGNSRVWTAINQGNRVHELHEWINVGQAPLSLALGDFNSDGTQDVVVANSISENLSFLENSGDGTLHVRFVSVYLEDEPLDLQCVDLDSDGNVDVVVTLEGYGRVGLLEGNGDWEFDFVRSINAGVRTSQVMISDLNYDFVPDIFVLDGLLDLGLSLLNVESDLVAVEPSALLVQCNNHRLAMDVTLPGSSVWSLAMGRRDQWQLIARDGVSVWGTCIFTQGNWRVDLSADQFQGIKDHGGLRGDLNLRLVVGEGAEAEELIIPLSDDCQTSAQAITSMAPSWVQAPYPNPFNPTLQAEFYLARGGEVHGVVLDVRGRRVATFLNEVLESGTHVLHWDGQGLQGAAGAGLYFLKITTEHGSITKKVVLLK